MGLTSWEEWQLGLDDQDSLSNGGEGSDFHWAVDRHLTGLDLELRDSIVKVVFWFEYRGARTSCI